VDAKGVGVFFGETDAVIADAKAFLASLALELFYVARAVLGQPVDRQEDRRTPPGKLLPPDLNASQSPSSTLP
jgi:hypothetical protein